MNFSNSNNSTGEISSQDLNLLILRKIFFFLGLVLDNTTTYNNKIISAGIWHQSSKKTKQKFISNLVQILSYG